MRREPPGAVHDHPDRQPQLTADHRRFQCRVAQLDDLGDDPVDAQVGVAGARRGGRAERGVSQLEYGAAPESPDLSPRRALIRPTVTARAALSAWRPRVRTSPAGVRAAGAQPVRGRGVPAAADVRGGLAEPAPWDLLGPIRYVGLDNWRSVLTDGTFGNSLMVTAAFVALVVPAQSALGLFAASMLARQLPGSAFFRTLYVLPWICAPIAIAVLWRWLLAPTDGAINTLLGRRVEWLTDPGPGPAGGVGRHRLDQRGLRDAVLPRRHPRHPRADPRRRASWTAPTPGSGSGGSRCRCFGQRCSSCW